MFIGCIEGTNEPLVKGEDAVLVTKIAEAALESSKTNKPVLLTTVT